MPVPPCQIPRRGPTIYRPNNASATSPPFLRKASAATGNGLPPRRITVTEEHTRALQQELRKYYWPRELRGRHCRVHHYPRCNGVDYFFAYLDDWPDKLLVFDDDGQIEPRSDRYAFTNVFAYDPVNGCIDLVAKGGKKVHQRLRQVFCRSILQTEVEDGEAVRPAYELDHLLDPNLSLPTDSRDCVSAVRLTRIRIDPRQLGPTQLCRLLNSTPLGEVISERQLHRHRTRAGFRIGEGRTVDLFRYIGWLVAQRHAPKPDPEGLFAEQLTAEYRVKTEGRGRTVDEWKIRPEQPDNHWLDGIVGCAVSASIQGCVLFGTDAPQGPAQPRVRLSALQRSKRG